jgi:hypothetical protein
MNHWPEAGKEKKAMIVSQETCLNVATFPFE